MRLFVGIALSDAVVHELKSVVARLRSNGGPAERQTRESPSAGLRWTAPESWHITLQFLGNATPEQLDLPDGAAGRSAIGSRFRWSWARSAALTARAFSLPMSTVTPGLAALAEARGGGDQPVRICGGDAAVSSAHHAGTGKGTGARSRAARAGSRHAQPATVFTLHGAGVSALRESFERRGAHGTRYAGGFR